MPSESDSSVLTIAKLLLDQGPTGVALVEGPDFTFVYLNEAYQAIAPDRPMMGRSYAAVWPEAAAEVVPVLASVRETGQPFSVSDRRLDLHRRAGGPLEESWWNITFQPLPVRAGEPASIAIHVVDRTPAMLDRRRVEALQEEQVAEAIPQIVWTAGADGETTWFNRRWYAYTGMTAPQVGEEPWRAALHEHDAPKMLNRWMTSLRAGEVMDVEVRLKAADGAYRWHLLRCVPVRGVDGKVTKWFGTGTDIEEQRRSRDVAELSRRREVEARKRAEEASDAAARRASEIDAVLDAIADGLVISNRENEFERANEAAMRLLGRLAQGSDWLHRFRVFDQASHDVGAESLPPARALRGEVVRGEELRLERRDEKASPIFISASAAPIRDGAGAIQGVVTTFTDISRLRELQERQSDLLRAISHDLRTPLTVIMTQAQMLQRRPEDPATVVRRAESLRTSAQRMAAMIDDLVDLVRLEAGLVKLQPRPVELHPFTTELRDRLRGALEVERLRLDVPEALPPAHADPPRLERILVNLITNALKYSPPESEAVLRADLVDGHLRVTVSDHGPGIPDDERERVFERFYRSPSATRKEGLGLGLYITRLLVEAHGGGIAVDSRVGHGSEFHVTLPVSIPTPVVTA